MIDIDAALTALSLEDKCRLLAGKTTWRTKAFPHAGIPEVKMSDGPNGVRGEGHGGSSTPGVVVPSGITLGASWDPQLLGEIGELLGTEARRKGAHILLGPTVNIHRTPVGGRTFECYSEDPELSGILAAAYVRGVQSKDVAVTVKHFVCNDTEMDRMSVDVQVDDRPLREIYLRPFERAVKEGGAWGIMSAYNRLGAEHCAENRRLLTDILRDEWGFDGFVVSDWFGVHHTIEAANAGLNIEMPAPVRVYGTKLVEAVKAGEVDEEQVDRLVLDVLSMINRVRADEFVATADEQSVDDPAERAAHPTCRHRRHRPAAQRSRVRPAGAAVRSGVDHEHRGHRAQRRHQPVHGWRLGEPHPVRPPDAARRAHRPARPGFADERHRHVRTRRAHRPAHPGRSAAASCVKPTASPVCGSST